MVAFILLIIGGLNLGLVSLGYDVLAMILGSGTLLLKLLYLLIGASAIYELVSHKKICKHCGK